MYFWTCWYTRRFRLLIYVVLGMVLVVLGALPAAMEEHGGHWVFPKLLTLARVQIVWNEGADHTVAVLLVLALFAAADLGALATGEDTKRREIEFLVTRPRPRRYFIWISWLAGLAQLLPVICFPLLASVITMFLTTHTMLPGALFTRTMEIFALAASMYALAFLLSVLTRNPQSGFQLAAFVIVVYAGIVYARAELWFIFHPWERPAYYGAFVLFDTHSQLFPFANLIFLTAATLALPVIADLSFRRQDL